MIPTRSDLQPVRMEREGMYHTADVWNRSYGFGPDAMLRSVRSAGRELLAAPVRLVGTEEGEPMVWDTDYEGNESRAFVSSRSDEAVSLCGAMRTERFLVNQKITVSDDGSMDTELTLMPAGLTVAEVFGTAERKRPAYRLDSLALEIPLRADALTHFSMYPGGEVRRSDGSVLSGGAMSNSGAIPQDADLFFPFEALLWLGREECGLGLYADSLQGRELADESRAIELCHTGDGTVLLRVRLFDHHPTEWREPPEAGCYAYRPLTVRFGLMATPVRRFPAVPYLHNALHLDCFVKTPGDYLTYLSGENRFDRLKEKGVNTLILHEKWNRQQNCFSPSEETLAQLRQIVSECHARDIRVLTYFGYEISTLDPDFGALFDEVSAEVDGHQTGGWYRVPFQRDYNVCYASRLTERLPEGVARVMDTCHTDGVYLDGTATPIYCMNPRHGCLWTDAEGKPHGSYPVRAVRELFRRLHRVVHSRGGYLSVHAFGCMNFTALPYIDQSWYGENLQFDYIKGNFSDVPLDYFRAEYTGRNMGVPVEFIAYEKRPVWCFENALAVSLIHGILPRPNDIGLPLELMSHVWRILDRFPLRQSEWCPYWSNGARVTDEKVKISYYRYRSETGAVTLLVFLANTACRRAERVALTLPEACGRLTDLTGEVPAPAPQVLDMEPYSYRIYYAE